MQSIAQREELHNTLWKIANELRGSMDSSEFKYYMSGFLFYYFISENLKAFVLENFNDNYEELSDEEALVAKNEILNAKGFYLKPSGLFSRVLKNHNLERLNEDLTKIFNDIEASAKEYESFKQFEGLFNDVNLYNTKLGNTNAERNENILKIMQAIDGLNLHYNESEIDILGDAYEYLMKMYAGDGGKKAGEFFTPQEVSKLLAKLTLCNNAKPNKIYDPACGSGSLLLQYKKLLKKDPDLGYFGQEKMSATHNLARMNMLLHNVNYTKCDIAQGDTLINPSKSHKGNIPFDAIVSNPPYSTKWKGNSNPLLINDERFSPAGVLAPKNYADLAFIMHGLAWLSDKGSAAFVCFPGVMYRSHAERDIRRYLIEQNFVDCVISLAQNLFFGTGVAVNILILRKNKLDDKVLFINADYEFIKAKNKNMLSEQNIENILKLYKARENKDFLSSLVSKEQIAKNDYNLSVSSYVEAKDTKEAIDIKALNLELKEVVKLQSALREQIDKIVLELEG